MHESETFDRTFRLYYEPLYRFCGQYVSDEADCHDIVMATFEDVWRKRDTLHLDTLRSYLYASVRNRAIDHLRRDERMRRYAEYAQVVSEVYVSEDHLANLDRAERIAAEALRRIGPPTSEVLRACYFDGKIYREVAEEMNMSLANVKRHMVKALKMLREMKDKIAL